MVNGDSVNKFHLETFAKVNDGTQNSYIDATKCRDLYKSLIFSTYIDYYRFITLKLKETDEYIKDYISHTDNVIRSYIQKKIFTAYFQAEDKIKEYGKVISSLHDKEFEKKNPDIFDASKLNYIFVSPEYCDQEDFSYKQTVINWKNIEEFRLQLKTIQADIRREILGEASCLPASGNEVEPS